MRRAKVIYRPEALSDLRQIYIDIADMSRSHVIANGFVKRIMTRCRKIGDAPNGGRPRDDLMPGLRTVPFEHSAVIAYHVTDAVEIVNVFYGGRDYEALFRAGDDEDEP
ncbi:type II toxin-antitoxin system RelE/ParE family toxin [Rhizobium leguminosarum]|jgi:toxin ParE1/3/4|uniref:type II toxin-antitoxin system RelE/ParE family toxin n=1 Tax=Rhizobium TaxID=379 RepID=UPI001C91E81D|nr:MULTISPECIES: type II toxin-antitoxin system RelE/ParE family toxin [Rhizobium]MBY3196108.1 type II toxin-antitoxin system RelE/ParE family toxin [Rhizobium laguerreae]MBY3228744.1 type II toxin-antitoxin system RelE/ParE family toxin [Rhizobium laguerreae]MBY3560731.1 type II toxin-antitoxin system RelE/ParE family toxin [Rhizobium laguerreae]MBY5542386.1 type II toxin-antitoxin system RelE/ParE family toxin [Rhizobium leguminosarum]MBY5759037.1 type II toxin-antitoxin system RelE/ParE fam